MSEYQYYEWQTIDRALTAAERAAVDRLSSHIEVGPTQAVVTYQWGDFKHDPKEVLLKYFDAHWYIANWGSQCLMFRFPKGSVDVGAIDRYCDEETLTFETMGDSHILSFTLHEEEGFGWIEGEGTLSDLAVLRNDIIDGDYRMLYLAWLKAMEYGAEDDFFDDDEEAYDVEEDLEDEEIEADETTPQPRVPTGLRQLNAALERFIGVFHLDPFLVQAAAAASPDLAPAPEFDFEELIARLTPQESQEFLLRLVQGDPTVRAALHKKLLSFVGSIPILPVKNLPYGELLIEAGRLRRQEEQRQEEQRRIDAQRQEELRRQQHITDMNRLAGRKDQAWQQVEQMLDNGKNAAVYEQATELLWRLQQLAEFQNLPAEFTLRLQRLSEKYAKRPSLIQRWKAKGWLD